MVTAKTSNAHDAGVPGMMDISGEKIRAINSKWNQQRRLEFIDFRLSCDGRMNRKDLVDFFGISVPQASLDVSRYCSIVQNLDPPRLNIAYNRHHKYYIRSDDFKPLFPALSSPSYYLANLLALSRNELPQSSNYFGFVPFVAVASFTPPRRNINSDVLFNIVEAIRSKMAVHIYYMSVSSNNNSDHLIAPHSFAYDGMRWHVRAYCYDTHDFRDFVLSRIISCDVPEISAPADRFPDPLGNGFREVGTTDKEDADWNDLIDLVLCANPALPERARRAIELDYGMEPNGTIVYTCRRALLFYALKWLRLTKEDRTLPAKCRQIVLDNEAEIDRRLNGGN